MTITEGILVALFIVAVVIGILAALSLVIKLFSKILGSIHVKKHENKVEIKEEADIGCGGFEEFSAGTLRLVNVDDETAAMIMAIVSDESGIPLQELEFKSIKLLN